MNLNALPRLASASPVATAAYLAVEDYDGIVPLDAQMGVANKRDIPQQAEAALFGGNDGALFALLDAAAIPSLQERLEAGGLEHRCLFTGKAKEDFHAVAPWLVRLERGSPLLRSMFTASGRVSDLWQKRAGIFLRSAATIDEICTHLRLLTRIQDADGKWYFFRLTDAEALYHYMAMDPPVLDNLARFFHARHGNPVAWVLPVGSRLRVLRNLYDHQPRAGIMQLSAEEFISLRRGKWWEYLHRVAQALRADHPQTLPAQHDLNDVAQSGFRQGFRIEKALYLYIAATVLCRTGGLDPQQVLHSDDDATLSQLDRAERFYRNSISMTAR